MRPAALLVLLAARRGAPDALLELETRHRVHAAVQAHPGSHVSEVARLAGLGTNHARYHLDALARADLVAAHADGGFVRYYPRTRERGIARDALGAEEKRILAALRREKPLHIVVVLLVHGPSPLGDLARHVGKAPPTVVFHLNGLVRRGLVERVGDSAAERRYALKDPARVEDVLARFPPRRDLVAGFIDVWDGLALAPGPGAPPTGDDPAPLAAEAAPDAAPPEEPPRRLRSAKPLFAWGMGWVRPRAVTA